MALTLPNYIPALAAINGRKKKTEKKKSFFVPRGACLWYM
jgi:hypothetical protein